MNSPLCVSLHASPEQIVRLKALQASFAEVCNALAPLVQQTRCWQRVTLHHLAYRDLRARFPQVGSQMVCNAIYSVSRTCRVVFQHPQSPWNASRDPSRPLPLLRFLSGSPVYFDRHTLSLKEGKLSMYTLDGRMHFQISLSEADQKRFREDKLREVVLSEAVAGFQLTFFLVNEGQAQDAESSDLRNLELPEYVVVETADVLSASNSWPSIEVADAGPGQVEPGKSVHEIL
jgi:hypothetical protein